MDLSRRRLVAQLFALFACSGNAFCRSAGTAHLRNSETASGIDLAGKPVDPLRTAAGKVTVLIFVRTDCPISNRYAPLLQKLSTQYAGKCVFWLVFPAKSEDATSITRYLTEYGYRISALRDPEYALVKLSHAETTPEAAVFDASGELVYHGRIDNWYEDFGRARRTPTTHELSDAVSASVSGKRPTVSSARAVGCSIADLR